MNYLDTVNWMFKQLPMYQNQGKTAFKKDLSNTILLAKHLKNPEQKFKSIHVAGTNGKGSTSHMIASVLQTAGYKVGLYTSPHLKDFRERIKINGNCVSKQFVIGFVKRNRTFLEQQHLSFFEMTVGMAFDYFAKQKVDIAVVEVGLGGRLDSTNIITPEVSVISNIGFDHTQFLGNTYEAIAKEKAGIIKPNVPVVIGETQDETQEVFKSITRVNHAAIYFADQCVKSAYTSDLKGDYQKHNIKTAVQALKLLNGSTFQISEANLQDGLQHVVKHTGLQGRWQVLQEAPKIICDTAHNKEGLTYIMRQLAKEIYNELHLVFGVVNDKDIHSILPLLPKEAIYYFCKPNVPRGLDAEILKSQFLSEGFQGQAYESVSQALSTAKTNASVNDLIYVGGSTFVVAEIV
ncbi:folylpolyglutamate synthase/dihydrofolate synthase family protein [Psychroserpens sp. SPM9]|uniref:bifunctional folylpolyglutamate synthase/dihydrofolate synthase n=1 Tax=Psychroserpens sp. SPM9 TaxID=2975598 RepID=UPI0021A76FCB|nr:folylpolyglutamate synthase/dihydrofolate synthase family protein [Psychroserpens sp. SPM9]MDG5492311.1 bifunctional folylpolyglutamate synthase/dihydrofolate synthase [Psychroserpens sp. SPM9]